MREAPAIDFYGGAGFRIAGERIEGSVLILDDLAQPWPVRTLAELRAEDFNIVLAAGAEPVEFILLGTGLETLPPPRRVREAMHAAGLGLEIMDTANAVRLYNVLAQEGRRIAAALIAI
jgi:uncharacterized protein